MSNIDENMDEVITDVPENHRSWFKLIPKLAKNALNGVFRLIQPQPTLNFNNLSSSASSSTTDDSVTLMSLSTRMDDLTSMFQQFMQSQQQSQRQ